MNDHLLAEKLKAAVESFQEIQRAGGSVSERELYQELVDVAYVHFGVLAKVWKS